MLYLPYHTLLRRCGHHIFALRFLLSFFFSSPNLSCCRLDVCHTCTHGLSANLGCRSETCCTRLPENTGCKNSLSGHYLTTLSGYILATIRKNLLSSNISSTCPHNMVNFDPLAAEISPVVWGIPANFNELESWQRYCTTLQ